MGKARASRGQGASHSLQSLSENISACGEPIVALGSDLEIKSGVRLLGVTDLVSEDLFIISYGTDWVSRVPGGGSPSAPPASGEARSVSSRSQVLRAIAVACPQAR